MVVDLEIVDGRLRPGAPRSLFEGAFFGDLPGYPFQESGLPNLDVAGDGETFVLQQAPGGADAEARAIIVFNWFAELERLVPSGR